MKWVIILTMKWVIILLLLVGCTATSPRQQLNESWLRSPFSEQRTVRIDGFVKRPGEYLWVRHMTIGDLITQAGGPTVFAGRIRLRRGSEEAILSFPKVGDKLWNSPVFEDETVTVLHDQALEHDSH